jgi:hypothetical protein
LTRTLRSLVRKKKMTGPVYSITREEIEEFWRRKEVEEEDRRLAAEKEAARIKAKVFKVSFCADPPAYPLSAFLITISISAW